jgi:hypothetical protein
VARAALTASSAGEPVSVSVIGACVSFDGGPGSGGRPDDGGDLHDRSPATVRRTTGVAARRRVIWGAAGGR